MVSNEIQTSFYFLNEVHKSLLYFAVIFTLFTVFKEKIYIYPDCLCVQLKTIIPVTCVKFLITLFINLASFAWFSDVYSLFHVTEM